MSAFTSLDGALNIGRDLFITPEQQAHRENQMRYLEMIKLINGIAIFVSVIFVIIFPNILTLVLAGIFAFCAGEALTVAANVLEMVKNVRVNAIARISRDNLITQISKNTLIAGSLLSVINPSHEEIIRTIDNLGQPLAGQAIRVPSEPRWSQYIVM